jgi:hypothetical protein
MIRQWTIGKFIFNAVFVCFLILFIVFSVEFGECFSAAERIPKISDYQVMRILIYGTSTTENVDTVSAVISLFDTSGNECAVLERSWRGSSLAIDLKSAEFSGKKVFFPEVIYGRKTIYERRGFGIHTTGTPLSRYYNENGQCMLFGTDSTYENRRDLYKLARFAFNPLSVFTAGFSNRYTLDLSRCGTGVYYDVTISTNGTIRIQPEQ